MLLKIFSLVLVAVLGIAPALLWRERLMQTGEGLGSDGAGATGDGGCYEDHHGGCDGGGHAGGDGSGSH